MFVDMIIFSWLAIRYKSIPLEEIKKAEEEEKLQQQGEEKKEPLDNF